jgi:hypothetical protein
MFIRVTMTANATIEELWKAAFSAKSMPTDMKVVRY